MRRLRFSAGSWYFHDSQPVTSSSGPNTVSGTRGSIGPSGSSQNTTAAMDISGAGEHHDERGERHRDAAPGEPLLAAQVERQQRDGAEAAGDGEEEVGVGDEAQADQRRAGDQDRPRLPYSTISSPSAPTA